MLKKYGIIILFLSGVVNISGCFEGINAVTRNIFSPKHMKNSSSANSVSVKCDESYPYKGGLAGGNFNVDLKAKSGEFDFTYSTYTVADAFEIFYEGNKIAETGCVGTGGEEKKPIFNTIPVEFHGNATSITVHAIGNCSGRSDGKQTAWQFKVGCVKKRECDFSLAQRCVGASGTGCNGNSFATKDDNRCLIRLLMTPGSIAHDNCCATHPNGRMCGGGNPLAEDCRNEWNLAVSDVRSSLSGQLPRNSRFCWFGPYIKGQQQVSESPSFCE